MILFAQADISALKADFIKSMFIFGIAMLVATSFVAVAIFAWLQYRLEKKSKKEPQKSEITPQPLAVTIVEEMHKQFADRVVFETHVTTNTSRHSQLFKEIDRVEREARQALDKKLADVNEDRRRTLDALNGKFEALQKEISNMPGKIVVDILNAQKIGRKND
jgi:hypothetical protein